MIKDIDSGIKDDVDIMSIILKLESPSVQHLDLDSTINLIERSYEYKIKNYPKKEIFNLILVMDTIKAKTYFKFKLFKKSNDFSKSIWERLCSPNFNLFEDFQVGYFIVIHFYYINKIVKYSNINNVLLF